MAAERAVDRRSHLRIPTDLRAAWAVAEPVVPEPESDAGQMGRVLDVALGGLALLLPEELRVGSRVQVRIRGEGDDFERIGSVWATVRWQRPTNGTPMRATGLQFDEGCWWHAARLTALAYRRKEHLYASRCVDGQACPPHRFRKCPAYLSGFSCWDFPGSVPCCTKKAEHACDGCSVGLMYCV